MPNKFVQFFSSLEHPKLVEIISDVEKVCNVG
jgi:hypothetical protein